jgi:hypothetical protein
MLQLQCFQFFCCTHCWSCCTHCWSCCSCHCTPSWHVISHPHTDVLTFPLLLLQQLLRILQGARYLCMATSTATSLVFRTNKHGHLLWCCCCALVIAAHQLLLPSFLLLQSLLLLLLLLTSPSSSFPAPPPLHCSSGMTAGWCCWGPHTCTRQQASRRGTAATLPGQAAQESTVHSCMVCQAGRGTCCLHG